MKSIVSIALVLCIFATNLMAAPAKSVKMDVGNKGAKIELMPCLAGEFIMGFQNKNIRDKDKFQWQTIIPHKVRITRPFWISKYPVTYAQFKMLCPDIIPLAKPIEVIKKNGKVELKSHDWNILLDEYGEDVAMCKVSYEDAVKFMGELTKRFAAKIPKGYVLRLPTEAEFEYALKEGGKTNDHVLRDTGRYDLSMTKLLPNGDRRRHLRFNRAGISEDFAWSLGHCGCKVGMSSPNKWGLYDMLGNMNEYTSDCVPLVFRYVPQWGETGFAGRVFQDG